MDISAVLRAIDPAKIGSMDELLRTIASDTKKKDAAPVPFKINRPDLELVPNSVDGGKTKVWVDKDPNRPECQIQNLKAEAKPSSNQALIDENYAGMAWAMDYLYRTNHPKVKGIVGQIQLEINSFYDAVAAAKRYDEIWFSQLFMYDDDKIEIARALLDLMQKFAPGERTWFYQRVVDNNWNTMQAIRYPSPPDDDEDEED